MSHHCIKKIKLINRSKIRLQRLKYVNNVDVKKTIINQSTGVIDIDFIIDETQSGEFKLVQVILIHQVLFLILKFNKIIF